ncbi:MAG: serine/threonine protein kinase [Pseudomonas sp.]|jgi:tRNA A-37 threonylcarbamoyl transferase component Bud32|nr:serine/threonine protein kinase [Pseudomonas sp.]MDD2224494.1 lipopolysaccharide kinase InaA family protein [Pseudomonas sp.]MDY0415120.1 lipopolysaccharide kinase InaA family protein [Pseudomonas sp.]NLO54942.1 serine/threonine protein kinase [Gammaproteobacteria bacterium]
MKLKQLSGRTPQLPLRLTLDNAQTLVIEQWLRVLPGQRYVGKAHWQGRSVLVKIFVGSKAARQFQRELVGAQALTEQQINSAAVVDAQQQADGSAYLLFEFIENAQSLAEAWQECSADLPLSGRQTDVLGRALSTVAQMHLRGLWQSDLHLDNLLQQGEQLYVVDGGGVQSEQAGKPLAQDNVIANLAVFFAQLPSAFDTHLEELLIHYLLVNAEHALRLESLHKQILSIRQWRVKDYLNKAGRECTLFSAKINMFGLRVVWRDAQAELESLLAEPDAAIARGHIYKTGGAATVARVEQGQRSLVVKRYNIKNVMHWLKRFWRPSRAWYSWREGHRLSVLGIATPQPLAVIENRCCGLRGSAWLISEYCGEQDIIARLASYQASDVVPETEINALVELLNALIREKISHGDLKGHNILWHQQRCYLIDLDAMQQHHSMRRFTRAYQKDRSRLLRNWPQQSPLYKLLDQRLPQLPSSCSED